MEYRWTLDIREGSVPETLLDTKFHMKSNYMDFGVRRPLSVSILKLFLGCWRLHIASTSYRKASRGPKRALPLFSSSFSGGLCMAHGGCVKPSEVSERPTKLKYVPNFLSTIQSPYLILSIECACNYFCHCQY